MSAATGTASPGNEPHPGGLVEVLLNVSLTGIMLLRPLYGADEQELKDFAFVQLNPVARQLLQLPERPTDSLLTLFPDAAETGVFEFYRNAFVSGQLKRHHNLYQHDGLAGYYMLAAQRHEDLVVVNFTDAGDQPHLLIQETLRESQIREQAAQAAAEAPRRELQRVFEQAPVAIAVYRGPKYIIELANPTVCRLWGRTQEQILGLGLFEALPEVAGMGYEELLDNVMATGEPHVAYAMPAHHDREGRRDTVYWDFVYVPMYNDEGRIDGAMVVATEVTTQVLARQEVEQLNRTLEEQVLARTQQLRQQSMRMERLIQEAPAAIAVLDGPDLVFEMLNEEYQALFPGRVLRGQPVLKALPELANSALDAVLRGVYETGVTFEGREVLIQFARPSDGQLEDRYFNFIYQARYDATGTVDGLVLFGFEVTEPVRSRQQTEALQAEVLAATRRQVQEREAFYQILEQTPAAVSILRGPEHRHAYANAAYQQFYPGHMLIGQCVSDILPEAEVQPYSAMLDEVYRTGKTYYGYEAPLNLLQKDDQEPRVVYFNFAYSAYREGGQIVGISVFGYEVTESVLAKRQREEQQAELQRIFAQAPVAVCVFRGPEYVLELVNPLMGEMLGHAPSWLIGQPFFTAMPELVGQGLNGILDEVQRTGTPFVANSQPIHLGRHQSGEVGYFDFVYQPLLGSTGAAGIVCVATEVTEQVLARQQVQTLNEELAAINEEMQATNEELLDSNTRLTRTNADLDTFVYSASHDLKSPITNIEGLLLALRQQLPGPALQAELVPRLLDMMDGAVARFQQTLGHLTDVSRLQQMLFDQPAEAVDLPSLVEAVRLDILPELTAARATLIVEVAECPLVYFSTKNLRSILYNLLSNAIKYHAPNRPPLVVLRCRRTAANQLVLEVQDNGLGLSETQQGELFRLFRRLHSHVSGSGVGLYMVKKMVENAGGTLAVQSELGTGSTFTVTLPTPHRLPL